MSSVEYELRILNDLEESVWEKTDIALIAIRQKAEHYADRVVAQFEEGLDDYVKLVMNDRADLPGARVRRREAEGLIADLSAGYY
jgi:hypothetical protein